MSYIHGSNPAGVDCAALKLSEQGVDAQGNPMVYAATAVATEPELVSVRIAVMKACNNIWASGGRVLGIEAAYLVPESAREIRIKEVTKEIVAACAICHTRLVGGHTEVTAAVHHIVVTITAIGEPIEGAPRNVHRIHAGMDIVVTKWMGLEAAALLDAKAEHRANWLTRFTEDYIAEIGAYADWLTIESEAAVAVQHGAQAMHDVSDGGIFTALWEVAEGSNCGFEVDLLRIPMRQPIIEVLEVERMNVYRARSAGSLMVFTEDGAGLVEAMEKAGIPACIIGQMTDKHDKLLKNLDEVRYLDKA